MKKQYLVVGLKEQNLVESVSLSSNGISTEESYYIVGTHLGTFTDINEAEKAVLEIITEEYIRMIKGGNNSRAKYPNGLEIKTILVKA